MVASKNTSNSSNEASARKSIWKERAEAYLMNEYMTTVKKATSKQLYNAVVKAIMADIIPSWKKNNEESTNHKKACYFSAEFLMGRALRNNLTNLDLQGEAIALLKEWNIDFDEFEDKEEDAGLGNGGLGRLAACFLDSAAAQGLPLYGYGIRYEYGIFKQTIVGGFQQEEGDLWLEQGDPWSITKSEEAVEVVFGDQTVKAVPHDMPILGYKNGIVNTLRLWSAEPIRRFDFASFNDQKYDQAVKDKNRAEDITKVLYPNDSSDAGKILRLKQQYFFVSASLQDMMREHKAMGRHPKTFADHYAVQLNDTHPAVAVPELMRILTEQEGMTWKAAWKITSSTCAYTNHTVLSEALEQWSQKLFKKVLPDIFDIIVEIDKQLVTDLKAWGLKQTQIKPMRILDSGMVKMAWLSIYGTHSTNGVAWLHTEILKNDVLKSWYEIYPKRFNNKTNGITQRRWLVECNPELTALITELLGDDKWIMDLDSLKKLERFADDEEVLKRLMAVKQEKKHQLAAYIAKYEGITIDPDSLFDIQIKRLHEYKRQLLSALHIVDLYYRIKKDPKLGRVPRTFIFGAKSAPGYFRAKAVIKFINAIADKVNNDPAVNKSLKVVFVQNYRVSYAERLFPAADISEQISTAGKEASGTGNMKFMLNATPTIGTYDGANVEIVEEAGFENNFIFGARVEELDELVHTYNPMTYYKKVPGLKKAVDSLTDGTFDDGGTGMFKELHDAILKGASWHKADHYFLMRDFEDYRKAHDALDEAYKDEKAWARKCLMNLANSGKFSSDRTIRQYASEIWRIESRG